MGNDQGIKKRVEKALMEATGGQPLTMGQIMALAEINKTMASDVSSALYKLRGAGLVRAIRSPSTSTKGPRFVRAYQWIVKTAPKKAEVVISPMAGLVGVFRI